MTMTLNMITLGKDIEHTCTEVMDPFFVVVILSCIVPMSVARVGWYPTADGIRPSKADT